MDYKTYYNQYLSIDPILARRCWAALLDYFAFCAAFMVYTYGTRNLVEIVLGLQSFNFQSNASPLILILLWVIYFPGAEAMFDATLGKAAFDLKVVYEVKDSFHFISSLKRHILDIIDFQFFGLVGILTVKLSAEHKRVGDFWGHTTVIIEQ
jgi:uncharacterized RDD family membrane protein YckC